MNDLPDLEFRDRLLFPESRKSYNELHFGVAASRYDLATRAISLGRDAAWKRRLVNALPAAAAPSCADLACGTGDVAFLLSERYPGGTIVGLDLSEPMLAEAVKRNSRGNVRFVKGDMCATGFPGGSFDIVTGSYALRNAPDLGRALEETRRILKPEGVAAFLDFSKPANPLLQRLQRRLLWNWCGLWGFLLHRTRYVHGYIAESLATFPDREELRRLIAERGFEPVFSRRFFLGMLELVVLRNRPVISRLDPPSHENPPPAADTARE
ncbi:MAG: class I SAM-dependent methyltransferase [Deltaproteobacteria bacterium]|nr:class I SAM-dependent methyltransferase [Deltaproteobacteria bacterium]